MPDPYPNSTYPTAYDEGGYVVSGDAPVNNAGTGLTIEDVAAGQGPLADMKVFTGRDVAGVTPRGDNVRSVFTPKEVDDVGDDV